MRPVFIIGNPRSGTTLLRLIVNAHTELIVPPECGFLLWWREKYGDWTEADSRSVQRLSAFLTDLQQSRKIETWEVDWSQSIPFFQQRPPHNYAELGSRVYEYYSLQKTGRMLRWGDKNNFHIQHLPAIFELYPRVQLLFIIRDGRDVACSYLDLARREINSEYAPRLPSHVEHIAKEWRNNNDKALGDIERLGLQQQRHILRYEDLVSRPEPTIQAICRFLEVPYEKEMLQFFAHQAAKEPKEFLQWKERTVKPITTAQVGRYRRDLSPEQIDQFESIAGDLLRRFEYS